MIRDAVEIILYVAVPSPLRQGLDYLPPLAGSLQNLQPGVRVLVPFRKQEIIGILLEVRTTTTLSHTTLKRTIAVLDEQPVVSASLLKLVKWASAYYQYPIGEVLANSLPTLLRQGALAEPKSHYHYLLSELGKQVDITQLKKRAPQQAAVLNLLQTQPLGLESTQLRDKFSAQLLKVLQNKGWLTQQVVKPLPLSFEVNPNHPIPLNEAQANAVAKICSALNREQAFLLYGVTGSGKTEVYLQSIAQVLHMGKQALLLVPEISLTPQTVARFEQRFQIPILTLHSGLSDKERLNAWLMASTGQAPIIIGTRSAIFTPLLRPGIIVVDEEHDASLKQQDGFRYSARDLAIVRGRLENIPVVLGSATPALESLYNVTRQKYQLLQLPQRAGMAQIPSWRVIDIRDQTLVAGIIAPKTLQMMKQHLAAGGQILVFLNRRGYAPTLLCHHCGWVVGCPNCDAPLTVHQKQAQLHCHHCGKINQIPKQCKYCQHTQLVPVGFGTERLEQCLTQQFVDTPLVRIDRDTTRCKGVMETMLEDIQQGRSRILLGTQMLAKGHHFPNVSLVIVLNADSGFYSVDFRAAERLAQLLIQVAGRAGRASSPGEVIIQTHQPDHPLLNCLVRQDYLDFARIALQERQAAGLPPYGYIALLRAEAADKQLPQQFLQQAYDLAHTSKHSEVQLLGPAPAPMERRAGRYRYQLLIQTQQRQKLQQWLANFIQKLERLPSSRRVRWSIDVDPLDLN